ncbi:1,4-beta cellobiohydrolase [Delitschia confertaspora ATCC 74209]|uniref:Glucanase n=1 Tax=Delitschia confertaspora ATCC 74209 TaxID=1513339 RepID=A0A9P4MWL0_9PLEO|nr:1,4-beta cellobiohydrolase [Delitschia confertaspora ATCC 74209]
MKTATLLAAAAAVTTATAADAPLYGQCGGMNWSGATTCVSGSYCFKQGDWYSQCLPGTGSGSGSTTAKTTATPTIAKPTTLTTVKTTAKGTTTPSAPAPSSPAASGHPYAGKNFYANPYYASEILNLAVPTISKTNAALAAKASKVAQVGTFMWLDTREKTKIVSEYAKDVQTKNKAGANLVLPLVVYDLPERDCAALASNGELSLANNGSALYQDYINSIATQIKAFPDVQFILIIEPDSLANMVTNMNVQKCANAADAYKTLTAYALKTLNMANVVMYLDAGHAGWLGWDANIGPAAKMYAEVYAAAGKPAAVRGLATNVANYNAYSISSCPSYASPSTTCDEKTYHAKFAPLLQAAGFPAHFIVDTGRNGVQPTKQKQWGDWCNVIGTGFGERPSTVTPDPLLDAFVWVKPGGECDGTSDTSAVRYDAHCGYDDALKPAPEAGTWFEAYFEQLLTNANPSF